MARKGRLPRAEEWPDGVGGFASVLRFLCKLEPARFLRRGRNAHYSDFQFAISGQRNREVLGFPVRAITAEGQILARHFGMGDRADGRRLAYLGRMSVVIQDDTIGSD